MATDLLLEIASIETLGQQNETRSDSSAFTLLHQSEWSRNSGVADMARRSPTCTEFLVKICAGRSRRTS
eukprot:16451989-Heterocapsa_arctica.AAC.1